MVKVLEKDKNQIKVEIENLTLAELLRKFLWEDKDVVASAWQRDHPTKNPILIVKTKNKSPKKAISDCIARVQKINSGVLSEFKKSC